MTGKPRNKPRVVESKVPIIGQEFTEKDKRLIDTAVQGMIQKVEPMLNGIGQMVDELGRRVAVVEEMVSATLVDTIAKRVSSVLKDEEIRAWEDNIKDRREVKREKREKK